MTRFFGGFGTVLLPIHLLGGLRHEILLRPGILVSRPMLQTGRVGPICASWLECGRCSHRATPQLNSTVSHLTVPVQCLYGNSSEEGRPMQEDFLKEFGKCAGGAADIFSPRLS